ncbi:MAG: thiamine ABC transporter substrate-binding protein [Ilumatobacteraceae bacterium]
MKRSLSLLAWPILVSLIVTGCGSDSASTVAAKPKSLTLVAYDSFSVDPTTFDSFTADTGIAVNIVTAGDAGTMLSKAELSAGNPEGDVMWGVDNTLLARATGSDVFEPYTSPDLASLSAASTALVPGHELTPVDEGDVCINYDIGWYADKGIDPPTSLVDLIDPVYADQLVVENAATSSVGLAFLLATVAQFGPDGWQQYWTDLRNNGITVVDGWDQAYYESFSGSSGKGPSPLVVSYGSSPPAEVIYGDPRPATAPTAVIESTCFHQVEFAGILAGTDHPEAAGQLIDFLISKQFQDVLPLTLFVYPARTDAAVPAEFTEFSIRPTNPLSLPAADIEANAQDWVSQWTNLVVR